MQAAVLASHPNEQPFICRKLRATDLDGLLLYLHQLSEETKRRFGPHPFDKESVINFYSSDAGITGYVVEHGTPAAIIAYAIIKDGILKHEKCRLEQYGVNSKDNHCCTFAPSVADNWQSKGIGKLLFNHIVCDCKLNGVKQMILWGGVQAVNEKAINFYTSLGFKKIGAFEYNGSNLDMLLQLY